MKSSSKFVVAIHILSGLAVVYNKKSRAPVSSENIAWSVNTNPVVIRRIIGALKKHGLVKTIAGAAGGAMLGKPPEKITLSEIYEAVEEGSIFHLHYKRPNPECPVGSNILGALTPLLEDVEKVVDFELAKMTLDDVTNRLQELIDSA